MIVRFFAVRFYTIDRTEITYYVGLLEDLCNARTRGLMVNVRLPVQVDQPLKPDNFSFDKVWHVATMDHFERLPGFIYPLIFQQIIGRLGKPDIKRQEDQREDELEENERAERPVP